MRLSEILFSNSGSSIRSEWEECIAVSPPRDWKRCLLEGMLPMEALGLIADDGSGYFSVE